MLFIWNLQSERKLTEPGDENLEIGEWVVQASSRYFQHA